MNWRNRYVQAPSIILSTPPFHSHHHPSIASPLFQHHHSSRLIIDMTTPVTWGHKLTPRNVEQAYIESSSTILPQPSTRSRDIWDINWIKKPTYDICKPLHDHAHTWLALESGFYPIGCLYWLGRAIPGGRVISDKDTAATTIDRGLWREM